MPTLIAAPHAPPGALAATPTALATIAETGPGGPRLLVSGHVHAARQARGKGKGKATGKGKGRVASMKASTSAGRAKRKRLFV